MLCRAVSVFVCVCACERMCVSAAPGRSSALERQRRTERQRETESEAMRVLARRLCAGCVLAPQTRGSCELSDRSDPLGWGSGHHARFNCSITRA